MVMSLNIQAPSSVPQKDISSSIHVCIFLLKPKVEVMPQGLSKLFGVSHQSANGARTMSLLVLQIYIEVLHHIFLKKIITEVQGTLNMNGGYIFHYGAFRLAHLVVMLRKTLTKYGSFPRR